MCHVTIKRFPNMAKLSGPYSFFPVEQETVNLLAKALAHTGMEAIGVKTMVITSATFAVGVFNLKKKKKRWNRIAKCLERLKTRVLGRLSYVPAPWAYLRYPYIDSLLTV